MKMKKVLSFIALFLIAGSANAMILASDDTPIIQTGQSHTSPVYDMYGLHSYLNLSVLARGDYWKDADEDITFSVNGMDLFNARHAGVNVLNMALTLDYFSANYKKYDKEYSLKMEFSLDPTYFLAESLDNNGQGLAFGWVNGAGVNPLGDYPHVEWTLAGSKSIPEPSLIALFGLGLLGLGFARRRKT
jgi:hypothetical protein